MAKVFIEETTLTAIGDAIRGKEGTTALVPVNDMATRITSLQTGSDPVIKSLDITSNGTYTATDCDGYSPITVNVPQDGAPTPEELQITGDCSYRFANSGWDWVIDKYGDKITTAGITHGKYMFEHSKLEAIPFQINISNCQDFNFMFHQCTKLKTCPKVRGTIKWNTNTSFDDALHSTQNIRDLEDLFTPEMLEGFSTVKVTGAYGVPESPGFTQAKSLRRIPSWWYKFRLNEESTAFPYQFYCLYPNMFQYAYTLDEAPNIPVWKCQGAQTNNMFTYTFTSCFRLKRLTFETNADGSPIVTQWKAQVIDLNSYTGFTSSSSFITGYNSGITADKEVKDDATYQALKNDPDWFATSAAYSRYNHDSAVETINSLPDTSAYLATAGGTNTIKFTGVAGSATDGGAINTLTEAEIAVATAKGWTVTLV